MSRYYLKRPLLPWLMKSTMYMMKMKRLKLVGNISLLRRAPNILRRGQVVEEGAEILIG